MNPLLDKQFLFDLDHYYHKEKYVKVISLDLMNRPLEQIEGCVTGGSINIDGKSSVRRSCNLTLITNELNVHDIYWSLTSRIKVEIGLRNFINPNYEDIIWFSQGVFILTEFKTSENTNGYTISLSGKDKMCLLNGDVSGSLEADTDAGTVDLINDNKEVINVKLKIKDIIRDFVHKYAREPFQNIIINDIDDYGLKMMEWRGDGKLYCLEDAEGFSIYTNGKKNYVPDKVLWESDNTEEYINNISQILVSGNQPILYTQEDMEINFGEQFDAESAEIGTKYQNINGDWYKIFLIINKFDCCGYQYTDLVYNDELIAQGGESVTSVFDKIIKMLGNFEYFYNINGQFVFQAKQDHCLTSWNNIVRREDSPYVLSRADASEFVYNFTDKTLITSFQNNPNINYLKNDYVIIGQNSEGIPIHTHYAIDEKPEAYKTLIRELEDGTKEQYLYTTEPYKNILTNQLGYILTTSSGDQLFFPQSKEDDFIIIDDCDWRELIYQMAQDYKNHNHDDDFYIKIQENNPQYFNGITGYEQYYIDIDGNWKKYLCEPNKVRKTEDGKEEIIYYGRNLKEDLDPTTLKFWFDFFDSGNYSDLSKYTNKMIGNRRIVQKEDKARVIDYPEPPKIIFITEDEQETIKRKDGYYYIFINSFTNENMVMATRGRTIHDTLDSLLYEHTSYNDSVQLNTIPIMYLEPNQLIEIQDKQNFVEGKYLIDKINISLTYNGTMSLTASQVPQRYY